YCGKVFLRNVNQTLKALPLLVKNNNSFLVKRNGVQFSAEQGNLTNLNSYKYSGLANRKTIGVIEAGKKGVVIITKKTKVPDCNPRDSLHKVTLTKGVRRAAKSFTNEYTRSKYRPDLRKEALARISAIYESQKPFK
ncbi:6039_t:CDS:2, partial [Ambispora leptoticha]